MSDETPPASILVVDDDPVVRRLVVREVERLGCGAVCDAASGLEAKRMLEAEDFDLVITDVMMPGLDGLALMRWAQEKRPDPSWIILSGLETFDAAVEAIQLGAFDFLVKPPRIEQLRVAVRNALERNQLVRERRQLVKELAESNLELSRKVDQLENLCGVMADQAEVIQRDLERAEVIQRALLPEVPPALGGFRVETLYRPGRNVGGDLYDVASLDSRYVVLLIADASGHGVSAAMLSVLFKLHLRMLDVATGVPASPARALEGVNAALSSGAVAPGMFITAAYCLLDTEQGEVAAASAGHPPLLLRRADGAVEAIERTGPALGVDADAKFEEAHIALERGDRLLLFTDGMLGPDATPDRVAERLARGASVQETLEALREGAERGVAPDERDDVSAILLEARVGPSRFDAAVEPAPEPQSPPVVSAPQITVGEADGATWLRIAGRGTWTSAEPFHAFAVAAAREGATLVLDFADCEHLDSTFLGSIHDAVGVARGAGAAVRLQGLSQGVRHLFEELSMQRVLACVRDTADPVPEGLEPLARSAPSDARAQQRVLLAHEALASLSDANREEFQSLVESLRRELGARAGGG